MTEHDDPGVRAVLASLHSLHRKVNTLMSDQLSVDAALQADTDALHSLAARVSGVEQGLRDQIASLQAQHPGLDVAALEAHLGELKATADAIDAAAPAPAPAPAPAITPAPAPATPTEPGPAPATASPPADLGAPAPVAPAEPVAPQPGVPQPGEPPAPEVPAAPPAPPAA